MESDPEDCPAAAAPAHPIDPLPAVPGPSRGEASTAPISPVAVTVVSVGEENGVPPPPPPPPAPEQSLGVEQAESSSSSSSRPIVPLPPSSPVSHSRSSSQSSPAGEPASSPAIVRTERVLEIERDCTSSLATQQWDTRKDATNWINAFADRHNFRIKQKLGQRSGQFFVLCCTDDACGFSFRVRYAPKKRWHVVPETNKNFFHSNACTSSKLQPQVARSKLNRGKKGMPPPPLMCLLDDAERELISQRLLNPTMSSQGSTQSTLLDGYTSSQMSKGSLASHRSVFPDSKGRKRQRLAVYGNSDKVPRHLREDGELLSTQQSIELSAEEALAQEALMFMSMSQEEHLRNVEQER